MGKERVTGKERGHVGREGVTGKERDHVGREGVTSLSLYESSLLDVWITPTC